MFERVKKNTDNSSTAESFSNDKILDSSGAQELSGDLKNKCVFKPVYCHSNPQFWSWILGLRSSDRVRPVRISYEGNGEDFSGNWEVSVCYTLFFIY